MEYGYSSDPKAIYEVIVDGRSFSSIGTQYHFIATSTLLFMSYLPALFNLRDKGFSRSSEVNI